jgi:hypothetical protein
VAFSPDGARLASGSYKTVKVWDGRTSSKNPGIADIDLLGEMMHRHQVWAPTWHAEDAAAAEKAEDWFAAAFHLGRLLQFKPGDQAIQKRHAQALQMLKDANLALPRLPLLPPAAEKKP